MKPQKGRKRRVGGLGDEGSLRGENEGSCKPSRGMSSAAVKRAEVGSVDIDTRRSVQERQLSRTDNSEGQADLK